jgi:hypothetical protein
VTQNIARPSEPAAGSYGHSGTFEDSDSLTAVNDGMATSPNAKPRAIIRRNIADCRLRPPNLHPVGR